MRRGAIGFSSSLLLLYTDAAATGIETEHKKWQYAFSVAPTLAVPLGKDDMRAFQQVLSYEHFWDDKTDISKPALVVEAIVMQKAINSVGGFVHPDHAETLRQGVAEGIASFKAKFPNRAAFLEVIP